MRWLNLSSQILILAVLVPLSGCANLKLAMSAPATVPASTQPPASHLRVLRTSYQAPNPPGKDAPHSKNKPTIENQPPSPKQTKTEAKKAKNADSPPKVVSTYTSPGLQYQQLAIAVAVAAVGTVTEEEDDVGRELSESIAFSNVGSIGRLGLTAPPTRLAGRVTSRPGLQEGPATGLGFAALDRNIFTLQRNRLSGPTGRCQDLARAGFFGGNRSTCQQSFRQR